MCVMLKSLHCSMARTQLVKIWRPSPIMLTYLYDWIFLEWDVKAQTNNKSLMRFFWKLSPSRVAMGHEFSFLYDLHFDKKFYHHNLCYHAWKHFLWICLSSFHRSFFFFSPLLYLFHFSHLWREISDCFIHVFLSWRKYWYQPCILGNNINMTKPKSFRNKFF